MFLQVYNNGSHAAAARPRDLTITDTQDNTLHPDRARLDQPVRLPRAARCRPTGRLPVPDTIAADGPTQGALLLFKIQIVSLDNRPLTLKIVDPDNAAETASAELDV